MNERMEAYFNFEACCKYSLNPDDVRIDERLLSIANASLEANIDKEQKSVPPLIYKGLIRHPNLNHDGTWRG